MEEEYALASGYETITVVFSLSCKMGQIFMDEEHARRVILKIVLESWIVTSLLVQIQG